MKCLHVLRSVRFESGGVARSVLDLCDGLTKHGLPTTLATADDTDVPKDWLRGSYASPGRPACIGFVDAERELRLGEAIRDHDVVHLHVPWEPSNLKIASLCGKLDTPYVISSHGMLDTWSMAQKSVKKRVYWWLFARRLLGGAAFVHTTAKAESDQAARWVPRGRVRAIPLLVDPRTFAAMPDKPWQKIEKFGLRETSRPRVLFMSRLHPKKGVELLIEAAALLRDRGVECDVWIAGPPHEPAYRDGLQRLIDGLGLGGVVRLLGMARGEEKWSLYRVADLFVLPTAQENFGLVLAEAMGCGLPVVTTRGVDIWQELAEGGATIVSRSAESIADAVAGWVSRPEERRRAAERGPAHIREWLAPERVCRAYVDAYRGLVSP